MRYRAKNAYEWSPEIAYAVGLMASDGCLQKDGRHLDLTSVDVDQLVNFSKALGRQLVISSKYNKTGKAANRVQFSDTGFYDFLVEAGLTPQKSKSLSTVNVPNHLYRHFLRGVFDGDGSTYAYFDKRWKSSYMFYVNFASASILFLRFLQTQNRVLAGTVAGTIRQSSRCYVLTYAKKDAEKLYQFMYDESDDLYLIRKKLKLRNFIKINRDAIIQAEVK